MCIRRGLRALETIKRQMNDEQQKLRMRKYENNKKNIILNVHIYMLMLKRQQFETLICLLWSEFQCSLVAFCQCFMFVFN